MLLSVARYIQKASTRSVGFDDIPRLHIGQNQCDQRITLTAAATDRRDANFLPPIRKLDNGRTGILLFRSWAAVTIPAELRVEVLLTSGVGEAAVAVGLHLTGHRLMHQKCQCAGIVPQTAVFDKVVLSGVAKKLYTHGRCHTLQLDAACINRRRKPCYSKGFGR